MKLIVTYKTFISCLGFFKFVSYFRYGAREVSAGAEGESEGEVEQSASVGDWVEG